MEFITEEETINCVRVSTEPETGEERREIVCSFNAQVDRVAPHVEAILFPDEVEELKNWLLERSRLQTALDKKPIENTILEALPALVEQAIDAVDTLDQKERAAYGKVRSCLVELSLAFKAMENRSSPDKTDQLQDNEALKERLVVIRDNLENKN